MTICKTVHLVLSDYCLSVLSVCNVGVCIVAIEVGLGPGQIVLDGDPAPPPKMDTASQFSAHVCCGGQTAAWIKMPLDTEVDLGPGDTVLDGDLLSQMRGQSTPNFGPCLWWQNCCMDQDET